VENGNDANPQAMPNTHLCPYDVRWQEIEPLHRHTFKLSTRGRGDRARPVQTGAADGPEPREVLKRPDWISEIEETTR
jgi:hypothetical protein